MRTIYDLSKRSIVGIDITILVTIKIIVTIIIINDRICNCFGNHNYYDYNRQFLMIKLQLL